MLNWVIAAIIYLVGAGFFYELARARAKTPVPPATYAIVAALWPLIVAYDVIGACVLLISIPGRFLGKKLTRRTSERKSES